MIIAKRKRGDHISERYRVLGNMHRVAAIYDITDPLLDRICIHVGGSLASQASTATAFLVSQMLIAKGPTAKAWANSLERI